VVTDVPTAPTRASVTKPPSAGVRTVPFAEPFRRFGEELARALHANLSEPTAMTLATADAAGRPSARMLLLKGYDEQGFVFYTNLGSRKALQLAENPHAALCFHWQPLEVQVRIEGRAQPVDAAEADAYFASRPHGSRIGAWASRQSAPLDSYESLVDRVAALEARFGEGEIPRPEFWSGYRLAPDRIEFWHGRPSRLHEREEYRLAPGDPPGWTVRYLYP
jgi:pyridoxamine 5'-phosphate oxidase